MKTVTFRADEAVIEAALSRARLEGITLNEAFERWLNSYAQVHRPLPCGDDVLAQLQGRLQVGHRLGRDERTAR
jgi:hypothetical protein